MYNNRPKRTLAEIVYIMCYFFPIRRRRTRRRQTRPRLPPSSCGENLPLNTFSGFGYLNIWHALNIFQQLSGKHNVDIIIFCSLVCLTWKSVLRRHAASSVGQDKLLRRSSKNSAKKYCSKIVLQSLQVKVEGKLCYSRGLKKYPNIFFPPEVAWFLFAINKQDIL